MSIPKIWKEPIREHCNWLSMWFRKDKSIPEVWERITSIRVVLKG